MAGAVWDFRMGNWRVPGRWQLHSIRPEPGEVGAHTCSADCQKRYEQNALRYRTREQIEADPTLVTQSSVEARRRSFRLVK